MEEVSSLEGARKAGSRVLSVLAFVAVGSGFLSVAFLGLVLAVLSWGWVGSVVAVPSVLQAGLALVVWLVLTTVIPAVAATLHLVLGATLGSLVAALGGAFLAWKLFDVVWMTLLVGYTMGFSIWYMEKK